MFSVIMPISVALSTFGGINGYLFTSSRWETPPYPVLYQEVPHLFLWPCISYLQVVFLWSQGGSPAQSTGHDPLQELHPHPCPAGLREYCTTRTLFFSGCRIQISCLHFFFCAKYDNAVTQKNAISQPAVWPFFFDRDLIRRFLVMCTLFCLSALL